MAHNVDAEMNNAQVVAIEKRRNENDNQHQLILASLLLLSAKLVKAAQKCEAG